MSLSLKKISGAVAPAFVSLALIFATSGGLLVASSEDAFAGIAELVSAPPPPRLSASPTPV